MRKIGLEFDGPHFSADFASRLLNTPNQSAVDAMNDWVQEQIDAFFTELIA